MNQTLPKIKEFYWSDEREPHLERRKQLMKKHPEVRKLFGYDHWLAVQTILLVIVQLTIAYYIGSLAKSNFQFSIFNFQLKIFQDYYNIFFLIITYFVGATASHALFLAIHEITHDLAFKKQVYNNWLALVANLPIVFPYAMTFKIYHALHHWQQGKDGVDTDIPIIIEAKTFIGRLGKLLWAINQILFYAFRPMYVHPIKLGKWQIINVIFQVAAMAVILPIIGWSGIIYLLLSIFIAGSLHPVAGHFISEHYVFKKGQETYSYYGPLNLVTFNVGYHNEHHDFPNIPGSRLPKLKSIAPEFYDTLLVHKSWTMVILKFIFSPAISLYSRVKRR